MRATGASAALAVSLLLIVPGAILFIIGSDLRSPLVLGPMVGLCALAAGWIVAPALVRQHREPHRAEWRIGLLAPALLFALFMAGYLVAWPLYEVLRNGGFQLGNWFFGGLLAASIGGAIRFASLLITVPMGFLWGRLTRHLLARRGLSFPES
ncbi:MAG: hypothetical protein U0869_15340 [Chloroflexota bacterium]